NRGIAQPGSAEVLGTSGRRFESGCPDHGSKSSGAVMTARIYQPAKSATQSGQGKDKWVLEYEPEQPRSIEPLMGWTSSGDMKSQVRLSFDTKEEAVAYAERNGIAYRLEEPKPVARRILSYSDNFLWNRLVPWSH